jgi:hypothetical protein
VSCGLAVPLPEWCYRVNCGLRLSAPVTVNGTGRYTVADRGFVSRFSICTGGRHSRRNRSVRLPHRQIQRDTGRTGSPPVAPGNNHTSFRADARNRRKRREGSRGRHGFAAPPRSPWSATGDPSPPSSRRAPGRHAPPQLRCAVAALLRRSPTWSRHLPGARHG